MLLTTPRIRGPSSAAAYLAARHRPTACAAVSRKLVMQEKSSSPTLPLPSMRNITDNVLLAVLPAGFRLATGLETGESWLAGLPAAHTHKVSSKVVLLWW